MRLPAWDELIPEQRNVMGYPLDEPLFVVGPPGSGKTVLAVRRAEAISSTGKTVLLITYNRMLRRLSTLLSQSAAVTPKTMHSFVSCDYQRRTGIALDTYVYDWPKLLAKLKEQAKNETVYNCAIVDEGQDLPQEFFRYLFEHASGGVTVFADEDQSLNDQGTTLKQIRAAANLPKPIFLKENHRNRPEIAALAEHFHSGGLPAATPRRAAIGQRPRLMEKNSASDIADFITTWFENRGGTVGVVVSGNGMGSNVWKELSTRLPESRVDFYDSGKRNEGEIALLDEGVTILTKDSVKGQEFDTVFILELGKFIPCANDAMKRAMYMMCARARDFLFLVNTGASLSPLAMAALPGPDILERG